MKDLKRILASSASDEHTKLYDNLFESICDINFEELDWKDPIANKVFNDQSQLIKSLDVVSLNQFMVCRNIDLVADICGVLRLLEDNGIRICLHNKRSEISEINDHRDNNGKFEINMIIGNEMEQKKMITTHNNKNRKLVGVYEDLGIIINRRREENEIIKDKWDEIEDKFDIDEISNLKEINDRNIQIDTIMEGEELEKLKDKMKQEFLINYYYKDDLKFTIEDSREMVVIKTS
ncbi:hypothetical protein C1645_813309 [Glomus cerebriforme]|uniref:Uncharacterized protein n=1 Tax=Glomus cerebriforme TaxID=658196 RepID=A0A397TNL2_9GLOM|nr:hypothetical protein C1645_813309 [Glomus cerebriforme]